MTDQAVQDPSFLKLIAGAAGALVSLRFVQGTWVEKGVMAIGGSALSYFGTSPAATYLNMANAEGLCGFIIGLFGMSIVAKLYELIQFFDAKSAASRLIDKIFGSRES